MYAVAATPCPGCSLLERPCIQSRSCANFGCSRCKPPPCLPPPRTVAAAGPEARAAGPHEQRAWPWRERRQRRQALPPKLWRIPSWIQRQKLALHTQGPCMATAAPRMLVLLVVTTAAAAGGNTVRRSQDATVSTVGLPRCSPCAGGPVSGWAWTALEIATSW